MWRRACHAAVGSTREAAAAVAAERALRGRVRHL